MSRENQHDSTTSSVVSSRQDDVTMASATTAADAGLTTPPQRSLLTPQKPSGASLANDFPSMDRIRQGILKCLFGPEATARGASDGQHDTPIPRSSSAETKQSNAGEPVISDDLRSAIEDVIRRIQDRRPPAPITATTPTSTGPVSPSAYTTPTPGCASSMASVQTTANLQSNASSTVAASEAASEAAHSISIAQVQTESTPATTSADPSTATTASPSVTTSGAATTTATGTTSANQCRQALVTVSSALSADQQVSTAAAGVCSNPVSVSATTSIGSPSTGHPEENVEVNAMSVNPIQLGSPCSSAPGELSMSENEMVTASGTLVALKPLPLPRRGTPQPVNIASAPPLQLPQPSLLPSGNTTHTLGLQTPHRPPSLGESNAPSLNGSFVCSATLTRSPSYASTISFGASVIENVLTPGFRIRTKADLIAMAEEEDARLESASRRRSQDTVVAQAPQSPAKCSSLRDLMSDVEDDVEGRVDDPARSHQTKNDYEIELERATRVTGDLPKSEVEEDTYYIRMHIRKEKQLRTLWEDLVRRYTSTPRASSTNSLRLQRVKSVNSVNSAQSPRTPNVAASPFPLAPPANLNTNPRAYSFTEPLTSERSNSNQPPALAPRLNTRDPSFIEPLPATLDTLELRTQSIRSSQEEVPKPTSTFEPDPSEIWEVPKWLWNYPVQMPGEPFALPPTRYVRPAHHPDALKPSPHVLQSLRMNTSPDDPSEYDDDDALSVITGFSNLSGGSAGPKRPRRKTPQSAGPGGAKTPVLRAAASSPGSRRRTSSARDDNDTPASDSVSVMSNIFAFALGNGGTSKDTENATAATAPSVVASGAQRKARASSSASAPSKDQRLSQPQPDSTLINAGNEVLQAMFETWMSMQSAAAALSSAGISLAPGMQINSFANLNAATTARESPRVDDTASDAGDDTSRNGHEMTASPSPPLRRQPRRRASAKLHQQADSFNEEVLETGVGQNQDTSDAVEGAGPMSPLPMLMPFLSTMNLGSLSVEAVQKLKEAQAQHAKFVRVLNNYQEQLQNASGSKSSHQALDLSAMLAFATSPDPTMFANTMQGGSSSTTPVHGTVLSGADTGTATTAAMTATSAAPAEGTTNPNTISNSTATPNLRLTLKIGQRH